ncbi:MAG: helix-turn-helix transcriptional regulator [Pseudomonadota bacterium]
MSSETLEKLIHETRRGVLVLAVLGVLRTEHYGYSLGKALNFMGISIDEGTLYPLIRRLEKQGLLTSEWREENKRRKRFYVLSSEGHRVFRGLRQEWLELNTCVISAIEED